MSSDRFAAELATSKAARGLLGGGAWAALAAGAVLIAALPVAPAWAAALLLAWSAASLLELRAARKCEARIERFRLYADGRLEGVSHDGTIQALELLSGSMVLSHFAWLRVRFTDGTRYGELLLAACGRADDWRRLRLIWRQRSSAFGRPRVSC